MTEAALLIGFIIDYPFTKFLTAIPFGKMKAETQDVDEDCTIIHKFQQAVSPGYFNQPLSTTLYMFATVVTLR